MKASWLMAALLAAAPASAQTMFDPMRPPAAGQGEAEVAVARSAGPVLEQIILGDGRKFAVIDGRRIALGEKFGNSTLIQIGSDRVTLKGEVTQVLKMFPNAGKTGAGEQLVPQPRKAEKGS